MATYLTIVNDVLTRMREDTVSSVSSSTYSTMVGALVNDAKQIVEQSWDWTALRDTIDVSTVASTVNYSLLGSGTRYKDLGVYDTTTLNQLRPRPMSWINKQQQIQTTTPSTAPSNYCFRGVDSNGDLTVDIYPTPDAVYNLKFNCVKAQAELSDDADILSVPVQPVRQLALALAVRERGETGGTSAQEYFAIADQALTDAIAFDATLHGNETVWYPH